MRQYELVIITEPEFAHEDEKKRTELVTRLLQNQTVSKVTIEDWGKKKLAYEIKKKDEGCYLFVTFSSAAVSVGVLEKQVKLTPQVVRYLLVRTA